MKNRVVWEGKAIRLVGVWNEEHEREDVIIEIANGTDRLGAVRWQDADEDLDAKLARRTIRELSAALTHALRSPAELRPAERLAFPEMTLPPGPSITADEAYKQGLLPPPKVRQFPRKPGNGKAEA